MNSLYGNALSIIYAVSGYIIILWTDKGNIKGSILMLVIVSSFTVAIRMGLKIYQKCQKQ